MVAEKEWKKQKTISTPPKKKNINTLPVSLEIGSVSDGH